VYGLTGTIIVSLIAFLILVNRSPDLSIWHLAELDEEFTANSDIETFDDYLALEDGLFNQLNELVYSNTESDHLNMVNRYSRGSMSDPERWPKNWNRSYQMPVESPRAAALLLHGMTDSPYSLRNVAEALHESGIYVVGLRIPGHGTAPSALVSIRWQDMAAAVRLAMRHAAEQAAGAPVFLVGYSNGGALAVNYVLDAVADPSLAQADRVVLLSPEIGVARVAALAIWQTRLGALLGLDKLAWDGLLPEYDPYKYGSFAVNAGDVAYRLTNKIQRQITDLDKKKKLADVPPILAFASIVDATVSTPALVEGLFNRLNRGDNELILFDVNHTAEFEHIMKFRHADIVPTLKSDTNRTYTLGLVSNKGTANGEVKLIRRPAGTEESIEIPLDQTWPQGFYSLSHVSLPFPPDDPLYGNRGSASSPGINIGGTILRGEKGALLIPAKEMLRVRWNPFYPFIEETILEFLGLQQPVSGETSESQQTSG